MVLKPCTTSNGFCRKNLARNHFSTENWSLSCSDCSLHLSSQLIKSLLACVSKVHRVYGAARLPPANQIFACSPLAWVEALRAWGDGALGGGGRSGWGRLISWRAVTGAQHSGAHRVTRAEKNEIGGIKSALWDLDTCDTSVPWGLKRSMLQLQSFRWSKIIVSILIQNIQENSDFMLNVQNCFSLDWKFITNDRLPLWCDTVNLQCCVVIVFSAHTCVWNHFFRWMKLKTGFHFFMYLRQNNSKTLILLNVNRSELWKTLGDEVLL